MKRITIQPTTKEVAVIVYDDGHISIEVEHMGHIAGTKTTEGFVGVGIGAELIEEHDGAAVVVADDGERVAVRIEHREEVA